jgi:predicted P-loop ATPase/GTPase
MSDAPGERLSAVIQVLQQPDPKSIGFVVSIYIYCNFFLVEADVVVVVVGLM